MAHPFARFGPSFQFDPSLLVGEGPILLLRTLEGTPQPHSAYPGTALGFYESGVLITIYDEERLAAVEPGAQE